MLDCARSADDVPMSTPTEEFFAELGRRGRDPRLGEASGSVRVDVHRDGDLHGTKADHWLITLGGGDVAVARGKAPADAVIHAEQSLFDQLVTGRANAMAAVLRGAVVVEGDLELPVQLQRIFPGPPADRGERVTAHEGARS